MLEIRDLQYSINGNKVLKGVDISIPVGHYFALAGENGAGKSTLIKIILDLIRNNVSGNIEICGLEHRDIAARQQLVYLPEKFELKKDVTGWQYLEFLFGVYRQSVDLNRVSALCRQMGLDESRLAHKTNHYSKGMKQKLGLISCFMLDNPLIILDEPLSGLDPKARFHFKELLDHERANGRTIFYSTHMLADADEICDHFAILHNGEIVYHGTPADCIERHGVDTLEQAYMACISDYPSAASVV